MTNASGYGSINMSARRLDARIKLPLMLGICFCLQASPDTYLPLWAAGAGLLFLLREMRSGSALAMAKGGAYFSLFWLVVKVLASYGDYPGIRENVQDAVPLAARLFLATLVAIAFNRLTSAVETGRAVSWFLTPVLGRRAWKAALALALVAHFLPLSFKAAFQVNDVMRARGIDCGWWRRTLLLLGNSLRQLRRHADSLAFCLASRRLDRPEAWKR